MEIGELQGVNLNQRFWTSAFTNNDGDFVWAETNNTVSSSIVYVFLLLDSSINFPKS